MNHVQLLFCLELCGQSADMRQNLHAELITWAEILCRLLASTNTGRCTSDDDSTRRERGALRAETDDPRNVENEIAATQSIDLPCVCIVCP